MQGIFKDVQLKTFRSPQLTFNIGTIHQLSIPKQFCNVRNFLFLTRKYVLEKILSNVMEYLSNELLKINNAPLTVVHTFGQSNGYLSLVIKYYLFRPEDNSGRSW